MIYNIIMYKTIYYLASYGLTQYIYIYTYNIFIYVDK